MRTRSILAASATAFAVAGGGLAHAHSEVVSTSPKAGSSASTSLRVVTVTFGEPIRSGTVRVTRSTGTVVSVGSGGRDPRNVRRIKVRLKGSLRAGRYTARWTAVAADGHRQQGSFGFRLRG